MNELHSLSPAFRAALLLAALGLYLCLEGIWPLRKATQPKLKRVLDNLALAGIGAIVVRLIFFPVVYAVSLYSTERHYGILPLLGLPPIMGFSAALLLLDLTLYYWHRINHLIPFFWRFHNVHHIDLDLDVTTASRFHFGELILSAGYRSAQVAWIGVDPATLVLFETLVTLSAQFHHANVKLPLGLERAINWIFVTPRMHGIHHSIVQEETDSNFSTIFSFWDRMHRSLKLRIPQSEIIIGVPSYREPQEVRLGSALLLPFRKQRAWKLPSGERPKRNG